MASKHDVIVVGLGAVGSAAAYRLAKAGAKVLGIDRFSPPHTFGSSHGDTRITRTAIGEGEEYTQLAMRSHTLWREMEAETGRTMFVRNGCLTIASEGAAVMHDVDAFFDISVNAARRFNLPHQTFANGAEIRARWPQFAALPTDRAILDEEAGYLVPEECVGGHLELAAKAGAQILTDTRVMQIEPSATGVEVTTSDGKRHAADRVLIAAGAWLPRLVAAELSSLFTVTRQVLHWFEIKSNPERFRPENCPGFIWLVPQAGGAKTDLYGFPLTGDPSEGVKLSHEDIGGIVDPDDVNRVVHPEDEVAYMYRTYIEPFMPDIGPRCLRTETCLYTRVDRARFIIDKDPRSERIVFASACSGHGFKHSAALGEALAEEFSTGASKHVDLSPFRLARLKEYLRA